MAFFRELTTGRGKNVIVMGRRTYETIPLKARPLARRRCCILSKTWSQENHLDVSIYSSIPELLSDLGIARNRHDTVFVIGGETIYAQFLSKYLYLCEKIYVTRFRENYQCDKFFPLGRREKFPPGASARGFPQFYKVLRVSGCRARRKSLPGPASRYY